MINRKSRFFGGVLLLSSTLGVDPCFGGTNFKHEPDAFICDPKGAGKKFVNPAKVVKADILHKMGIKGQTKDGKRLKIAIIDGPFHPDHIKELSKKGVIHKEAYSYVLPTDDKDLKESNLLSELDKKKYELRRKLEGDSGTSFHGSSVVTSFLSIAPEAEILPLDIDLMKLCENGDYVKAFNKAIQIAIDQKVDLINYSVAMTEECVPAMETAAKKGIMINLPPGNYSTKSPNLFKARLNIAWDENDEPIPGKLSGRQILLNQTGGKNVIFWGAHDIQNDGEEALSWFSSLPNDEARNHFMLAPGSNLSVKYHHLDEATQGTSYSTPIGAGVLTLLMQYARDKGYKYGTSDDLLQILKSSGRTLTAKTDLGEEIFKSVDLKAAIDLLDKKFRPKTPFIPKAEETKLAPTPAPVLPKVNLDPKPIPVPSKTNPVLQTPTAKANEIKPAPAPAPNGNEPKGGQPKPAQPKANPVLQTPAPKGNAPKVDQPKPAPVPPKVNPVPQTPTAKANEIKPAPAPAPKAKETIPASKPAPKTQETKPAPKSAPTKVQETKPASKPAPKAEEIKPTPSKANPVPQTPSAKANEIKPAPAPAPKGNEPKAGQLKLPTVPPKVNPAPAPAPKGKEPKVAQPKPAPIPPKVNPAPAPAPTKVQEVKSAPKPAPKAEKTKSPAKTAPSVVGKA